MTIKNFVDTSGLTAQELKTELRARLIELEALSVGNKKTPEDYETAKAIKRDMRKFLHSTALKTLLDRIDELEIELGATKVELISTKLALDSSNERIDATTKILEEGLLK